MTDDVKTACNEIISMVREKRKALAGRPATMEEVFNLSQAVVSFMGYVIPHRVEAEANYNQIVASLVGDNPIGKAQILAKASPEYRDWRYIEYVYAFADAEQMLLKKLLSSKEKEYHL